MRIALAQIALHLGNVKKNIGPWKRDDRPEITLTSLPRTLLRHDN